MMDDGSRGCRVLPPCSGNASGPIRSSHEKYNAIECPPAYARLDPHSSCTSVDRGTALDAHVRDGDKPLSSRVSHCSPLC
jgi:hypothetical protein